MKVVDHFSQILISNGVTDVFGIPGGVILKLLNALIETKEITPHLNYHEQMAGFAACGYAQASGRLGVAYATRGPGISNMFTCIAEAFQESLPVLFITAHGRKETTAARFGSNQEMDIVSCVKGITKYAVEINSPEDIILFDKACRMALGGRKGPVLVDVAASLFDMEAENIDEAEHPEENQERVPVDISYISERISAAKRPIILIGDGLRYCSKDNIKYCLEKLNIPVLSSRGSQDIFSDSSLYFGYVGSHGIRYSNFILSKADLIVAVGNRLAFPIASKSYSPVLNNSELIRVDIDSGEFSRDIPGSTDILMDGEDFLRELSEKCDEKEFGSEEWTGVCTELMKQLCHMDCPEPVDRLKRVFSAHSKRKNGVIVVSDVGNNEFWVSRAFEAVRPKMASFLCSKAFGALGNGLGKAIGAYFAMHCPVICIMGDQGFQLNIQELQFIARYKLPILIVVMNNKCSGMISDHERNLFGEKQFLVDDSTGYSVPDVKKISEAYGLEYFYNEIPENNAGSGPLICEISYSSDIALVPALPIGSPCQDMTPSLDRELYNNLNDM